MQWNIKFTPTRVLKYSYYSECQGSALGMEHGHINDADITASSTFDYHSVGPHIGRWFTAIMDYQTLTIGNPKTNQKVAWSYLLLLLPSMTPRSNEHNAATSLVLSFQRITLCIANFLDNYLPFLPGTDPKSKFIRSRFCCLMMVIIINNVCRARQDVKGGAWCPALQISSGVREWLEINLHTDFR